MRHRKIVMALLGLGVIGGYGSGIAHLACMRHHWQEHQQMMMNQFARTCVDAARTGNAPAPAPSEFAPGQYGPGPYGHGPWGWGR